MITCQVASPMVPTWPTFQNPYWRIYIFTGGIKNPQSGITNPRGVFSPPRLGAPSWPPFPRSLYSYFASFSSITWVLGDIIDANCSSWSILAIYQYAAFLGWLISAAQWKIIIRGTSYFRILSRNLWNQLAHYNNRAVDAVFFPLKVEEKYECRLGYYLDCSFSHTSKMKYRTLLLQKTR